jgi:hypothetical protein
LRRQRHSQPASARYPREQWTTIINSLHPPCATLYADFGTGARAHGSRHRIEPCGLALNLFFVSAAFLVVCVSPFALTFELLVLRSERSGYRLLASDLLCLRGRRISDSGAGCWLDVELLTCRSGLIAEFDLAVGVRAAVDVRGNGSREITRESDQKKRYANPR